MDNVWEMFLPDMRNLSIVDHEGESWLLDQSEIPTLEGDIHKTLPKDKVQELSAAREKLASLARSLGKRVTLK